ncbi:TMhelix containing protein [Vibrio phage 1.250.O._10N.261.55.E11]|nr:TMhelix containing protein [Vibrio phage 1.250.O._10N.261.55.E11]
MPDYKLDKSPQKTWVRDSQPKDKPLTGGDKLLAVIAVLLVGVLLVGGFKPLVRSVE